MTAKANLKSVQKSSNKAKTTFKEATHKHHHTHQHEGSRPHPLTQFFGCCLGDDPAPISPKIQSIRENLGKDQDLPVIIRPGQYLVITPDMVVADLLINFPQIKPLLEDLHPLGLLSPVLDQISLEIFFADLAVDVKAVCQQLESLVNQ